MGARRGRKRKEGSWSSRDLRIAGAVIESSFAKSVDDVETVSVGSGGVATERVGRKRGEAQRKRVGSRRWAGNGMRNALVAG